MKREQQEKMFSDIGLVLMDIGKLVIAGIVLTAVFEDVPQKGQTVAIGTAVAIVLLIAGIFFGIKSKEE